MSRTDALSHPDLRPVWNVLETTAPVLEWHDLDYVAPPSSGRRRVSIGRLVVVAVVVSLLLLGTVETRGVFAARRAIADSPVVLMEPVGFPIESVQMDKPWRDGGWSVDLSDSGFGITAHGHGGGAGASEPGWLLDGSAWTSIELDAELIVGGAVFAGNQYLIGRQMVGSPDDRALVWRQSNDGNAWDAVFSIGGESRGAHLSSVVAADGMLWLGGTERPGLPQAWRSTDGTTWTEIAVDAPGWKSAIHEMAVIGDQVTAVGMADASVPFVESVQPAIWVSRDDRMRSVAIPGLRALGFGYLVGALRLSDGLEHVVVGNDRDLAYASALQVWDGFGEDMTLEPREAWASLVVVSTDGEHWAPSVLADFAVETIIPFGDGFLAAAWLPPMKDTEVIRLEDGSEMEVAAMPMSTLFYSTDGLGWAPVAESPGFGKPLLVPDGSGGAVAIDEYQAEDETESVQVFRLSPAAR